MHIARTLLLAALCAAGAAPAAPASFPLADDGAILTWLLLGPFPRTEAPGLTVVDAAEFAQGRQARGATWEWAIARAGGLVDLESRWPRDDVVAYAACWIMSPVKQRATISVGSDDGIKVWLEGTLVLERAGPRVLKPSEDRIPVGLNQGRTLLVLEVTELLGGWGFQASVSPAREPVTIALPLEQEPDRLADARVEAFPFMRGTRENPEPVVRLRLTYLGAPAQAQVAIAAGAEKTSAEVSLRPGPQVHIVPAPAVAATTKAEATLTIGGAVRTFPFDLPPLRRFEVFLVQHTHTDIGYTADQPDIVREHLRFIDEALACVEATAAYPPEARFKWVCEVNWGAHLYLNHRPPAAVAALKAAAAAGRIEMTAVGLNMTDVATEEVVIRTLGPIARLRREGFEVVSAMQNDCNGFPWALPRLLADVGVKYFSNGINETRSKVPFNYPRAIWWESPDGSPLLTWRGPHYMGGNFLGLVDDLAAAEAQLGEHLAALADRSYPHDCMLIPLSGQFTDNSPPTTRVCDIVKAWNERWAYPILRTATLKDFFTAFEAREAGKIPRYRKAWCDWWADGIGAGADELAIVRRSQESLAFSDGLLAVTGFGLGDGGERFRRQLDAAYWTALFFDEHTYGAFNSVSAPGSLRAKHGWLYKASFAAELGMQSALLEDTAASGLLWQVATGDGQALLVYNALPWERTAAMRFSLPRSQVEASRPFRLRSAAGEELAYQELGEELLFVKLAAVAPALPPCGYRTWQIVPGAPALPENPFTFDGTRLSNGIVEVAVDAATGAIATLKIRGEDMVAGAGAGTPYGFGQYIYEEIVKAPGRSFLWPRQKDVPFQRRTPKGIAVRRGEAGPVVASLVVSGAIAEGHTVACEISLWRDADWVELAYTIHKPATVMPEAAYIAFPWRDDLLPLRAEVAGGLMEPGKDQIERSASDWHSIQDFVTAGAGESLGVWVTPDAPLVQFGDINTGKYQDVLTVAKPILYSWPMNNYWFTNFPAQQGGEFAFRYAVGRVERAGAARRFARERVVAPRAYWLPPGRRGPLPADRGSFLAGCPCLAAVKPAEDGDGLILRFRNYSAASCEPAVVFSDLLPVRSVEGVDILEGPKQREHTFEDRRLVVPLGPNAAADVRVRLGPAR